VRRSSWYKLSGYKCSGWALAALIPAITLAAMTVSPRNLEKALQAQRELVQQQPRDARAYNDLGNLLVLAGDLTQAEQAYLYALELDPDKVSTRFNLALLLQQTGRFRDALAEYQKVLSKDPSHAWTHYQVGSLYDYWHQDDLAIEAYAQAFSLNPQLAFSEINPHVIDNRLLTEALLKAHRAGQLSPAAPKAYDDPVRIGHLLIPPVPVDTSGEEEGEDDEGEEPLAAGRSAPGEQEAAQLLTDGDLDPNAPANQAAPPAGVGRGSIYRPPSRIQRPPRNLRQFQQRQVQPGQIPGSRNPPQARPGSGRPLGNVVVQPNTDLNPGGANPTNPLAGRRPSETPSESPPQGSTPGFRPGTASTGRLDIQLTPVSAPRTGEEPVAG